MQRVREAIMKWVFFISALTSILAIALICLFLFVNGIPAMAEIGVFNFLLGKSWKPSSDMFGILPMILGSIYVTGGALLIGVPIGILTATYLASFCPKQIYRILRPMIELLAGIPSVVYGFFGLVILVPSIRDMFNVQGMTMLAASVLLGIMILPTVITVSESSLRAVPEPYLEGALALGATKERSVFFVIIPAAKSGVMAAVALSIGRAIGETMAVIMVAGNQARMPESILKGLRTLTANIVLEMGYAADLHRGSLIASGVVLFVFILIINMLVSLLRKKERP